MIRQVFIQEFLYRVYFNYPAGDNVCDRTYQRLLVYWPGVLVIDKLDKLIVSLGSKKEGGGGEQKKGLKYQGLSIFKSLNPTTFQDCT